MDKNIDFFRRETFPILPVLSTEQVKALLRGLSTNKAITLDGLSDTLFQKENIQRAAEIFKDLWSIDLNLIKGIQCSLTSRLIPLNKVFPDVPNRKQMRPILVCSPIQKVLESSSKNDEEYTTYDSEDQKRSKKP